MSHHSTEQEGVIKFHVEFDTRPIELDGFNTYLSRLNIQRSKLKQVGLLGQEPGRYGGDGFGNISVRIDARRFLISGSQTGHLEHLSATDVSLVTGFDVQRNQLQAEGLCLPSSESMTHGVAYKALSSAMAVVHVHSPDIWGNADHLSLPATARDIPYGTPEMAQAVSDLLSREAETQKDSVHGEKIAPSVIVFVMKGHDDGVVAVGPEIEACTQALLEYLNIAIEHQRAGK